MKTLLLVIVLLGLIIGTPAVYARHLTDSEIENGIASDAQGRVCNYGPDQDMCHDRYFETVPGTSNYIDYHSAYKIGYAEGFKGEAYNHSTADNAPSESWGNGYLEGWDQGCTDLIAMQHTIDQHHNPTYLCSH